MNCPQNDEQKKYWNLAVSIGGGLALGVCAVAAVAAAPIEIAATGVALVVTKVAVDKLNEDKEDDEAGRERVRSL